jgi:hypothetical protein
MPLPMTHINVQYDNNHEKVDFIRILMKVYTGTSCEEIILGVRCFLFSEGLIF